ncbi:39S ribosomal protein L9, mitochondrial isoform X1 [Osmerus mordax]|uniref:39S ribosomal protein L9, mitochondrial isoform X1 n=1 Tax=Osmerus mordax TaxID=8014 RepID=UPI00350ECF2A
MWSTSRRALQGLVRDLSHSHVQCFSQTACKNTVVVERWWQVPLSKEGRPPRLHPRRHRVYKVVEDTKHAPKEKMELILTQTVKKLGGRGDTVIVKKSLGRNKLLAEGLAVYPSPENKDMFSEELRLLREGKVEDRIQTRTGQMTVEFLKNMELKITKQMSLDYVITSEIVCRQFLKRGIVVPPHALRLPDEPIKDLGDYWCEVTVNGINTVRIPMSVVAFQGSPRGVKLLIKQQEEEPEAGVVAASEEGVVAASEEGVVAASEEGVVAASEEGVVAASEAGVVAASEEGVVAASEAGVAAVSEAGVAAAPEAGVSEAVSEAFAGLVPEASASAPETAVAPVEAAPTVPEAVPPALEAAASAPEASAPEASAPEASAPEASGPEAAAPEAAAPEAAAPEAAAPEAAAPEAAAPEAAAPEAAAPEAAASMEAAPAAPKPSATTSETAASPDANKEVKDKPDK